jgi:soluble lytic murein transglycosylase-like protein
MSGNAAERIEQIIEDDGPHLEQLLAAIAQVESGSDPNAYNEAEQAAGMFQLRPIYVKDVNRILNYDGYSLEDRYDPNKCVQMMCVYWAHYLNPDRIGRYPTYEDYARVHNGGPDGHKKASTRAYWKKVKDAM